MEEIQITKSDSPLKFTYQTPEGAVGLLVIPGLVKEMTKAEAIEIFKEKSAFGLKLIAIEGNIPKP
ncbi:MAG: hypothetical protein AAF694_17835 [Bacteroidota bacterium]